MICFLLKLHHVVQICAIVFFRVFVAPRPPKGVVVVAAEPPPSLPNVLVGVADAEAPRARSHNKLQVLADVALGIASAAADSDEESVG